MLSARAFPPIETLAEVHANPPPPPAPVVDGLLRRGDVLGIVGPLKCGKSTLALQLARNVVEGGQFLAWKCAKGCALFLHTTADAAVEKRPLELTRTLRNKPSSHLTTISFHGCAEPLPMLVEKLLSMPQTYSFDPIAIDPLFRFFDGHWLNALRAAEHLAVVADTAVVVVDADMPEWFGNVRITLAGDGTDKSTFIATIDDRQLDSARDMTIHFEYPVWRRKVEGGERNGS